MGGARPETGQSPRISRMVLGLARRLMLNFPLIPGIDPVHDNRGTKMNVRQLSLCAVAGALLGAGPGTAFAQSGPEAETSADAPALPEGPSAPDAAPPPPAPIAPQAYPMPVYPAPAYPAQAYPAPGASYAYPGAPPVGAMAYPRPYAAAPGAAPAAYPPEYQQARADWISECAERYRHKKRDGKGGLIGGLLGAAIGGFAGNRIDDHGDRWAGTLIGAGIGGVAGAALGTLAGKSSRRKLDEEAFAWCEDYLASHTTAPVYGYGQPYGYGAYGGGYGPVMMVPVMVPKGRKCQEEVVEEVAEPPRIRRYIPKPAPDKRIKLAPAKTKRIKYSKTQ